MWVRQGKCQVLGTITDTCLLPASWPSRQRHPLGRRGPLRSAPPMPALFFPLYSESPTSLQHLQPPQNHTAPCHLPWLPLSPPWGPLDAPRSVPAFQWEMNPGFSSSEGSCKAQAPWLPGSKEGPGSVSWSRTLPSQRPAMKLVPLMLPEPVESIININRHISAPVGNRP